MNCLPCRKLARYGLVHVDKHFITVKYRLYTQCLASTLGKKLGSSKSEQHQRTFNGPLTTTRDTALPCCFAKSLCMRMLGLNDGVFVVPIAYVNELLAQCLNGEGESWVCAVQVANELVPLHVSCPP